MKPFGGALVLVACSGEVSPLEAPEPPASHAVPAPVTQPGPLPAGLEALGTAGTWQFARRCDDSACLPVLVDTASATTLALPIVPNDRPWAIEGIELEAILEVDLTGDGRSELRVDWRSIGAPRAALGSFVRTFATVVDPASRQILLNVEVGHLGGDSEEHCAGTLAFGRESAVLEQTCQLKACLRGHASPEECAGGPKVTRRTLPLEPRP
jgi:hypothetical protein